MAPALAPAPAPAPTAAPAQMVSCGSGPGSVSTPLVASFTWIVTDSKLNKSHLKMTQQSGRSQNMGRALPWLYAKRSHTVATKRLHQLEPR